MKNFNFKRKGSALRVIEEPVIKKKKWTFDRLVYIFVVLVLGYNIAKFSYKFLNEMSGHGQIVFHKTSINFTTDIRLDHFFIKEGEKINKGDTLFSYEIEKNILADNMDMKRLEAQNSVKRNMLSIKKEVLMKKAQLKSLMLKVKHLKEKYDHKLKLVLLDVENKVVLDEINTELNYLIVQKEQLKEEMVSLNSLKEEIELMGDQLMTGYEPIINDFYYTSPIDGVNGKINFEPNEVCYRQEEVLTIHNSQQVEIYAYFSQKYASSLEVGRKVKIIFQDGTKSIGKIGNTSVSTHTLPSEFQKKYEPTQRSIVVSIIPIDSDTEVLWRTFYLMDVKLIINHWFF